MELGGETTAAASAYGASEVTGSMFGVELETTLFVVVVFVVLVVVLETLLLVVALVMLFVLLVLLCVAV